MKLNPSLLAVAAGLSAVVLSGCVVTERTSYYRDERRPYGPGPDRVVVVDDQPRGNVVVVHRAAPAPLVERVPGRPGPDFIWVPGYWAARGDDWYWVGGHYERPPRAGAIWVQPRYAPRSQNEVEFSLGFWR